MEFVSVALWVDGIDGNSADNSKPRKRANPQNLSVLSSPYCCNITLCFTERGYSTALYCTGIWTNASSYFRCGTCTCDVGLFLILLSLPTSFVRVQADYGSGTVLGLLTTLQCSMHLSDPCFIYHNRKKPKAHLNPSAQINVYNYPFRSALKNTDSHPELVHEESFSC